MRFLCRLIGHKWEAYCAEHSGVPGLEKWTCLRCGTKRFQEAT